jgi:hypothetical protein
VFSQILIVETLPPAQHDRSPPACFPLLLWSATSAVVTGLVCDVYHVQRQPERRMYAQYAPSGRRSVAYSASNARSTLPGPCFQVIQAHVERGA